MVLEDRKDQLFISMLEAQQVRRTLSGIIWLWGLGCYSHTETCLSGWDWQLSLPWYRCYKPDRDAGEGLVREEGGFAPLIGEDRTTIPRVISEDRPMILDIGRG